MAVEQVTYDHGWLWDCPDDEWRSGGETWDRAINKMRMLHVILIS